MGWDKGQAKSYAKRIADKYRAAWFVLAPEIREAVVSEFVLSIVLGQVAEQVGVEDVRSLRTEVCKCLASRYHMRTETSDQHAEAES